MLVAIDENGNRIYANAERRYTECFCPECGRPLIHKKGKIKIPHFAHEVESECAYGKDGDNKSEWHRHMQELFPPESLEVRFKDENTGEVHIADVFLEYCNTVIEFQHSSISEEEFVSRTMFHIKSGRRIVWVFDESGSNPESEFGRLKKEEGPSTMPCHTNLQFKWLRSPRRVLSCFRSNPNINVLQASNYSVCVYYGEQDIVHRIISAYEYDYSEITLSVHPIKLGMDMNIEEFFLPENEWLKESPYREIIEQRNMYLAELKAQQEKVRRDAINSYLSRQRRRPRFRF